MAGNSIESIVDAMTLAEQVVLLSGEDFWSLPAIARLGIGKLRVTDGPNGARGGGSLIGGVKSASFPVGIALGATWNPRAGARDRRGAGRGGQVEGRARAARADDQHPPLGDQRPQLRVLFGGPGADRRAGGRLCRGAAGGGVAATPKHFVGNESEIQRTTISSEIDERDAARGLSGAVRGGGEERRDLGA